MSTEAQAGTPADEPETAVLTAMELRKVAEWAHSIRGPGITMVVHPRLPDGSLKVEPLPAAEAQALGNGYIKIPIDTENRVNSRLGLAGMRLGLVNPKKFGSKPRSVDFFAECRKAYKVEPDAMFWTESAVEKFLVPYYASIYSSDAGLAERVQEISDVFDGKRKPKPHATLRLDDESEEEASPGEEVASLTEESEVTVYALVHLPKSEYVASPPDMPTLGVLYSAERNGKERFMIGSLPGRR